MQNQAKFVREILLGVSCCILGLIAQFIFPEGAPTLRYPLNLQFGLLFSVSIIAIYLYASKLKWVKLLASPQLSIISMIMVAVLVLCAGLIPQEPSRHDGVALFGLRSVTQTWYFAFSMVLLLLNLGLVILRHTQLFNRKNIGFILNHFGLWLTLLAGYLGAGDMVRLRSECGIGESCSIAFDNNKLVYRMPFTVQLNRFVRKDYTPTLVAIHSQTNKFRVVSDKLKVNETYKANNETFKFLSFDTLHNEINGIRVKLNTDTLLLTTGLDASLVQVAALGNDSLLLLKRGSAKSYTSFITLNGKLFQLGVNNPLVYKGWTIYQTSYDEDEQGNVRSIFEFIRDPWLPIVYTGFILVLIGALFLFWEGKNNEKL